MNKIWLNKTENKNCILFFNGWGMDKNAVQHLQFGAFDVYMLNDYNPLENFDNEAFLTYEKIYLAAWSMGVWAATMTMGIATINIEKAIAINGTPIPIHEEFGIPKVIFDHTLETWNLRNREKFNMRIFGGRQQYALLNESKSERELDNQIRELENIRNKVLGQKDISFHFDCALVGQNDLIFSRDNQVNFWQGKAQIIEKEIPHFPFAIFNHWEEIIAL